MRRLKKPLSFVCGFLLSLFAITFVAAQYSDYTARAFSSELLSLAAAGKLAVSESLVSQDSVELAAAAAEFRRALPGLGLDPGQFINLSNSGTFVLSSVKGDSVMVLKPMIMDTGIPKWRCIGGPAKNVSRSCRGDKFRFEGAVGVHDYELSSSGSRVRDVN